MTDRSRGGSAGVHQYIFDRGKTISWGPPVSGPGRFEATPGKFPKARGLSNFPGASPTQTPSPHSHWANAEGFPSDCQYVAHLHHALLAVLAAEGGMDVAHVLEGGV